MLALLGPALRPTNSPAISVAGNHHHLISAAASPPPPRLSAASIPPFRRSILSSKTLALPLNSLFVGRKVFDRAGFVVEAVTDSFPLDQDSERAKLVQVAKRLEKTSRNFKRWGSLGFWGQLVCTLVAAGILSFSVVVTGKVTSPVTFYATATSITAGFVSVFWSFGYLRLSERLHRTANEPSKAPPRADVVKGLKNGIVLNLLGLGAAILGMQATVGLLVGKALTTSAVPYYQGPSPGQSPVLALDVFLVQASANTILSHFLGLVSSLELLRTVALPPGEVAAPVPKLA